MRSDTAAKSATAGSLLAELDYLTEAAAADAVGLTHKTLKKYREMRIGPAFSEVGRQFMYSKENLQKWLATGGKWGREAKPAVRRTSVPKKIEAPRRTAPKRIAQARAGAR